MKATSTIGNVFLLDEDSRPDAGDDTEHNDPEKAGIDVPFVLRRWRRRRSCWRGGVGWVSDSWEHCRLTLRSRRGMVVVTRDFPWSKSYGWDC